MLTKKNHLVLATVTRLLRRGALRPLEKVVMKSHASDLARIMGRMPQEEAAELFAIIPDTEHAAEVLAELDVELRDLLLREMPVERIAPILEQLSPDDRTDIIGQQEPELAARLMEVLDQETQDEVEELLQYAPDSAGGIMTPDVFSLPEEMSVEEAMATIREQSEVELIFYLYVVAANGRLVGVVSLRQLLIAQPEKRLKDIMNTRVIKVYTQDDQEEAVSRVEQYGILGLPVVDEHDVLVGLITMDDIIDVLQDETTEDMLKMAGTGEGEMLTQSPLKIARMRLPWLGAAFLGGLAATGVIRGFEDLLTQVLALSAFLPIVMGMAGNVGTQSATVAVRGLATGQLDVTRVGSYVVKEFFVGLMLGAIYGLALGILGWLLYSSVDLGWIVGLTIFGNMTGAAVIAILLPILFNKIGADPAIATGPFVTTAIDILGVANFFLIASLFIGPTLGI